MVGIVVVSHSRALARAAVALAAEMLQGRPVPIAIAAGLDEETFGTDAVRIAAAITEADQGPDGVVVLMDLGSAVLSAELALELLADDDLRERVLLCPAPLVEGLVVAAVTALSGAGRAEVAAEALAALTAKQAQLQPDSPEEPEGQKGRAGQEGQDHGTGFGFTVTPAHGLHARPTARLVQALQGLDARVELRNVSTGSGWVPGASLSRLGKLAALRGHEIEVRAFGAQADEAGQRLLSLARGNFGEPLPASDGPDSHPGEHTPSFGDLAQGDGRAPGPAPAGGPYPASPGIGIGPARLEEQPVLDIAPAATPGGSPASEQARLDAAIDAVGVAIGRVRARVATELGEADAAIFGAHLALLADPELLRETRSRIGAGQGAVEAWVTTIAAAEAELQALADPYLRARAGDVQAVGAQVHRQLLGTADRTDEHEDEDEDETSILVAADLTPSRAATLDRDRVGGVVLAFGSPTAHSAILVRARGIPAVVGAGPGVLEIADGTVLALDGSTGELVVDPAGEVLAAFSRRAAATRIRDQVAHAEAAAPAVTRDGVAVLVGANVGSPDDARAATASGADLIGLVRTEFLFLNRMQAPDVDEQEAAYRELAELAAGRRLTLRTLDVGGDKPLDYLPQPAEANPFLGLRGIRLSLRYPQLLRDQLLAMVRLAHETPVSIMFPMVSTLAELLAGRRILDEAIARAGRDTPSGLRVGMMIEVPAAALKAGTFANHLDFLSIGTNDLTQYALAAERGNDAVTTLGDPLDPGVLHLIDATCRGAGPGTTVGVCGELAADERAAGLLLGLGVRELSVTPRAVPGVKQAVRALDLGPAATLAAKALTAADAGAVRELLSRP